MKKLILLSLLGMIGVMIFVGGHKVWAGDTSGKTFFMPRSIGSDGVLFHAGSHHFIKKNKPSNRFFLSASAFYQESTNSKDLSRYFFPCGKDCLQIKGALAQGDRDISGTWLQIAGKNIDPDGTTFPDGTAFADAAANTTHKDVELYLNEFESKITIRPEFKRFGTTLQLYKNLGFISNRLWMSLDFPCIYVETNTRLRECNIKNAIKNRNELSDNTFQILDNGGEITRREPASLLQKLNATEAFNNPLWKYGKIKCGVQKLAGLADINGKLGFDFMQKKSIHLSGYGKVVIPTGYEPTAEFMFEPIVGNGQHFGLGVGATIDVKLIDKEKKRLTFASNIDYVYLFSNTQKRSFDLTSNGQWSRYLLVVDRERAKRTLQPGINFFTQDARVTPKSEINWTNSLNFSFKKIMFEAGYNFWYKSKESIRLNACLPKELFIANTHFGTRDIRNAGDVVDDELFDIQSFSSATIKKHLSDNEADREPNPADAADLLVPVFTKNIKSGDLNLCSGAHPSYTSHKFYLATGLNASWKKQPFQAHVGGSYEFADGNKGLDLWSIWLKFSINV